MALPIRPITLREAAVMDTLCVISSGSDRSQAIFIPWGKAGGLQILRCQGLAVEDQGGTLAALTLKPSGSSNIGVNPDVA